MPITDRVQVLIYEEAAKGGDPLDDTMGIPTEISPQEDGLETAGVYFQDASNRDENVYIDRNGDDLRFRDVNNAIPVTLSTLTASSTPTLDSAITAGTPDNDVDIPLSDPVIWRDAGAILTPLSIIKTNITTTEVGLNITLAGIGQTGVRISNTGTSGSTDFRDSEIRHTTSSNLNILSDISSIFIRAGNSSTGTKASTATIQGGVNSSTGAGGDTYVQGGVATGGGGDGAVYIGVSTTSAIQLGTVTIPTTITGNLNLISDGSLDGTVNKTAGIQIQDQTSNVSPVKVISVDAPPDGQVTAAKGSLAIDPATPSLYQNTDGSTTWSPLGGSGDVTAAATLTDNRLMRGDTPGPKGIQNSGITVTDSDALQDVTQIISPRATALAGAMALGDVTVLGTTVINASSPGSVAIWQATANASGATSTLEATSLGAFSAGRANSTFTGTALLSASGIGSFAGGHSSATSGQTTTIKAGAQGAFAAGAADSGGLIEVSSSAAGGFAHGSVVTGAKIRATSAGAFASGSVQGTGSQIVSSGAGSFASGTGVGISGSTGQILASNSGSIAGGFALGIATSALISASGQGSLAWGNAANATISASATNSVQFGIGTNAIAGSLQVGDTTNGLRFISGGTTSTIVGSFWTDGTDVFCRTGGVTKNLTNI